MNMNTLLHDFVSEMEGRAEQQQQSTTSSASPGLDRKRKVDHETEEPAFLDEAAPAVPPSANGDDDAGKMNHLKKSPESDNDSTDHRGRKAVKSGNDHAEQEDSSSSAQTSPNDSGLDKPTEGEDQDGDDEVVAVAEDDEAADARSRDQEPTDGRPPSPPPLPPPRPKPPPLSASSSSDELSLGRLHSCE
jgi:hypothetical protein